MKEIVIKIDDAVYERLFEIKPMDLADKIAIDMAIKNGKELPKGHGRLIDEKELIEDIECEEIDGKYCDVIYVHSIYDAETIIEADKENDE